jgi:hypothetical protein
MATSRRYSKKGKRKVSRGRRSRKSQRRFTRKTIRGGDLQLTDFKNLNDVTVTQIKISLPLYKITVVDELNTLNTNGKKLVNKHSQSLNDNEECFKVYMNFIYMKWEPIPRYITPKKSVFSMFMADPNQDAFYKAINYIYLEGKSSIPIKSIEENSIYKNAGDSYHTNLDNKLGYAMNELSNIKIEMKYCYNIKGDPVYDDSSKFYKEIKFNSDTVVLTPAGFVIQNENDEIKQKFYFRKVTCYGKDSDDSSHYGSMISGHTYPLSCDVFKTRVLEYFQSLQSENEKNKIYELTK